MSRFFLRHGLITVVSLLWILLVESVWSNSGNFDWHKGCYPADVSVAHLALPGDPDPVTCSRACLSKQYTYAVVQNGTSCGCLGQLSGQPGARPVCNVSCSSGLPCGGRSGWSVYSSSGPYLLSLNVHSDGHPYVGHSLSLQAWATFAALPNGTLGLPDLEEVDPSRVFVAWTVNADLVAEENVTAEEKDFRSALFYKLTKPGNYSIVVTVSNGVSTLSARINTSVVLPVPTDLQLILLTPQELLPTCAPENYTTPDNATTLLLFANSSVHFEASVALGTNLTFDWRFTDDDSHPVATPYMDSPVCSGRNCTSDKQRHIFAKVGLFQVITTVYNGLGRLREMLYVVVVERGVAEASVGLPAGQSVLTSPDTAVLFMVAMETTARHSTTLEINFGDGTKKTYFLQEKRASLLGGSYPGAADDIYLSASYGEGCMLHVDVKHTYRKEGVFRVWVRGRVSQALQTDIASLSSPITVMNALEKPFFNAPTASGVALNVSTDFEIKLTKSSNNVTYYWAFWSNNKTISEAQNFTTTEPAFMYSFTETGLHYVHVMAENLINSVETEMSLHVQVPIEDLNVTLIGSYYIETGSLIKVAAQISQGTEVQFEWDFGESSGFILPAFVTEWSSEASHTYSRAGQYEVMVKAYNMLPGGTVLARLPQAVVVQDAVENLRVTTSGPTLLGNATVIDAKVTGGTSVTFQIDLGNGDVRLMTSQGPQTQVSLSHRFATAGTYIVTVHAFNNVSKLTQTVQVAVQEAVTMVTIHTVQTAVAGQQLLCIAKEKGEYPERTDMVYIWSIDGRRYAVTTTPLIDVIFNTNATYEISLQAQNMVDTEWTKQQVSVQGAADKEQSLYHDPAVALGQPTRFTLQNLPQNVEKIVVEYGKGLRETENPGSGSSYQWEYTYSKIGLYKVIVCVKMKKDNTARLTATMTTVQEPLSGLELTGPRAVPVRSTLPSQLWNAGLTRGSHVAYRWQIGDEEAFSTSSKLVHVFTREGTYNISVEASNNLGTMRGSIDVKAQHPISMVNVQVRPVIHGQESQVVVTMQGSKEFRLLVKFGDGNWTTISEQQSRLAGGSHAEPTNPVTYKSVAKHQYGHIGQFEVLVNASNDVSWMVKSTLARVDEPIEGIRLVTAAPAVVAVDQVVIVTATVTSGNDLTFQWDFSNGIKPQVTSTKNSSRAVHSYAASGQYQVSVYVSNPLYSRPIRASLPFKFVAVGPLTPGTLYLIPSGDAAKLTKVQGNFTTGIIRFGAQVTQGSDVTFTFDYGDGTKQSLEGTQHIFTGALVTTGQHRYKKVGAYSVSVTASNALGNISYTLPKPFYVQKPPTGLTLPLTDNQLNTALGNKTRLRAYLDSGTDVQFDWDMGDQQEYVKAGLQVEHLYRQSGSYLVVVKAYNKVATLQRQVQITVLQRIQGVDLVASKELIGVYEALTLTATVHPQVQQPKLWFKFHYGDDRVAEETFLNRLEIKYIRSGRYILNVTANNKISSAVSDNIQVRVQAKLDKVRLQMLSEPIVGQKVEFLAHLFSGSDPEFHWHFGDGTTRETYHNRVFHTFKRVGEYHVKVYVRNLLNQENASRTVFVLERPCRPPEIKLLAEKSNLKFERSSEIKIETEVSINCTVTLAANYMWMLRNATSGQEMAVGLLGMNDPMLYLPSRTLPYGFYSAQLKVQMNDTIVYSLITKEFQVVRSSLLSVIKGGIQRSISYNHTVTMDASMSVDPDFPDADDLRYAWTCAKLDHPERPCFINNDTSILGGGKKKFDIPGHVFDITPKAQFNVTEAEFLFNLTVWKTDRRRASTTQSIKIEKASNLEVSVLCSQCEDNQVNADSKLVLQAKVANWHRIAEEDLQYEWRLYTVADGTAPLKPDGQTGYCAPSIPVSGPVSAARWPGSVNNTDGKNQGVDEIRMANTTHTSQVQTTTAATTTEEPTTTTEASSIGQSRERPRQRGGGGDSAGEPMEGLFPRGFMPQGPPTGEGEQDRGRSSGPDLSGQTAIEEGTPGQAGSANSRRGLGTGQTEGPTGGRGSGSNGGERPGGPEGQGGDPVTNPKDKKTEGPTHILNRQRQETMLRPNNTTTGKHGRSLIIKPGVLQERSYIIEVKVKRKSTGTRGAALAYFRVNKKPTSGKCTYSGSNGFERGTSTLQGFEMDTKFSIFCSEWQDPDLPLQYEVSYSIVGPQPLSRRTLVYRGFNPDVHFQLPAGRPQYKYKVRVYISVLDNVGARTEVCQEPFKIRPRQDDRTNTSIEQQLYRKVHGKGSQLKTYVEKGDNRNARLYANLVACRLNRLKNNGSKPDNKLRQDIRNTLLTTLKDLPVRDEYEMEQTMWAVVSTTQVAEEVTPDCQNMACDLLEEIEQRVTNITTGTGSNIISLVVQGSSNVLSAALKQQTRRMSAPSVEKVVHKSTKIVHQMLKKELKQKILGEEPAMHKSDTLTAYANRYTVHQSPPIQAGRSRFQLPHNMLGVLENNSWLRQSGQQLQQQQSCYQAHLVTYSDNPYSYGPLRNMVQSKVASLTLYTCDGKELDVKNLTTRDEVTMEIPHHVHKARLISSHTLHKHRMNIHRFDSEAGNGQRSLHITFNFVPVKNVRLFPILLLLSHNSPPSPTNYLYKQEFRPTVNQLSLFLKPGMLTGNGTYYLGVVDANFDAGRPRKGEARVRQYALRLWWAECLYWEEETRQWQGTGCQLEQTSTYDKSHCRCSHLTMFGAHHNAVDSTFSTMELESIFGQRENVLSFSFVTVVLVLYIILLVICVRHDKYDERKGTVVHLMDNSASDKQKYAITFETGFRRCAGTTAMVSLVLHGEDGMSETRELLSQTGQPLFERNSRDTFIMTLPDTLGPIWKVQIWHNNSGPSPSWYLSRVTVADMNTGNVYYFSCEKWFAVEEEDGKVEREIMALEDDGLGIKKVLWAKGTQYFADYHMWCSLLTKPPHSRFSRAQRLTCCVSLVLSYMALNTLWYYYMHTEYRGEFALVDLSWLAMAVGVASSLAALPLHLLIQLVFRRTKIRRTQREEVVGLGYPSIKRDSMSSDDSTINLLQTTYTPSIFDQSILNWQNLQDWAQRTWSKRNQQSDVGSSAESVKPVLGGQMPRQAQQQPQQLPQPKRGYETEGSSGFEDYLNQDRPRTASSQTQQPVDKKKVEYMQSLSCELPHSKKPSRCFMPSCMRAFAWLLLFLLMSGASGVTVYFGYRFGHARCILWLQSLFFSIIQCVFITHPLAILVQALYTAVKYRNSVHVFDHYRDGIILDHRIEGPSAQCCTKGKGDDVDELTKGLAARQRSRYLRFARPPQEKQLIEARTQTMKEKKAVAIVYDTSIYIVVFVLLMMVVFGGHRSSPYYVNAALKNFFVRDGSVPFESVRRVPEWWTWSQTSLLDAIQEHTQYNELQQEQRQVKGAQRATSAIVGHVNLRQLRIVNNLCSFQLHPSTRKVCHYAYSEATRDTMPHGVNNTWTYKRASETRATSLQGQHGYYGGDGYMVQLARDRTQAYQQLTRMQQNGWIDEYTRAVIVEFTVFNPPTNLFSTVSLVLEQLSVGAVQPMHRVVSTRLYKYISAYDHFILACELLFLVIVLLVMKYEVNEATRLKNLYLTNPWNCVQVTLCLLTLVYIACFIFRVRLVADIVELMHSTYLEEFVDVSYVALWDKVLHTIAGIMVFLVLLQFLKLLRHHRMFARLGKVYRRAAPDIVVFGVVMLVWLFAYTSLGVALYGAVAYDCSSFGRGMMSLIGLLSGSLRMEEMLKADGLGSGLLIISFLICVSGLLTAYMIAILSHHYHKCKRKRMLSLTNLQALAYYWRQLLLLLGVKKQKDGEDADNTLPPEFTMAEIEYQVEELLFKMNALTGSHGLPEKPPTYFTDSDCTYGVGDDGISSGGSEVRPFDEERLENRIHKIEGNLLGCEPHLAQLIQLDSIGADVLSQEKEKQLVNQLELEIFRQLQMQRQDQHRSDQSSGSGYPAQLDMSRSPSHDSGNTSSTPSSGTQRGLRLISPAKTTNLGAFSGALLPSSLSNLADEVSLANTDTQSMHSVATPSDVVPHTITPDPPPPAIPMNDALVLQDVRDQGSDTLDDGIPMQEFVEKGAAGGTEEDCMSKVPIHRIIETDLQDTVSRGSTSEHSSLQSITGTSRKGLPSGERVKSHGEAGSSKSRPEDSKANPYDGLYATSSSSDCEAVKEPKVRSLRKTKSRGKGKGRSRLTTVHDLSFDNGGYSSESDFDVSSTDSSRRKKQLRDHRQCWS